MRRRWITFLAALAISGNFAPAARSAEPFHSFLRKRFIASHDPSPAARLARGITELEEDLRATGTITIKEPDVWGETNLMSHLQEYEADLLKSLDNFKETTQAYVARADLADAQVTAALGQGLGKTAAPTAPTPTPITFNTVGKDGSTTVSVFGALNTALGAAKPTGSMALEPAELERQHSNYVKVNQGLRRLNQGDDNSRRAADNWR